MQITPQGGVLRATPFMWARFCQVDWLEPGHETVECFRRGFARIILFALVFCLASQSALAIERRDPEDRDGYAGAKENSYFLYPLAYSIPGIGSGSGAGGTIVHLLGDDSTLSLIRIRGEYEVDSVLATDIPLGTKHLTLSLAYADSRGGGFAFYDRGPDSSEEPAFTLQFNHIYGRAMDISGKFFDGQLEFYSGMAVAIPDVNLDKSDLGVDFEGAENLTPEEQEELIGTYVKHLLMYFDLSKIVITRQGIKIDYTDDRIDPRVGVRFQYEHWGFDQKELGLTNFSVDDYFLTAYIPNDSLSSVWVMNLLYSKSEVIKASSFFGDLYTQEECIADREAEGETGSEEVTLDTICNGIRRGIADFMENEANNSNATSLGGPNRLRSYPVYRFHDKYAFFAGLEYRMYFWERRSPFDFIVEKGVYKAAQLALFYEIGQVGPRDDSSLYSDFKYSAGLGLRLVFSSVVLRADFATGAEGAETTLFIGYGF